MQRDKIYSIKLTINNSNCRINQLVLVVLFFFAILKIHGQTTFIVDYVPEYTNVSQDLFLSGSFNNWNPSDPDYKFTLQADGNYVLANKEFENSWISYKITRGSWETVEVKKEGLPLTVRKHSFNKTGSETVTLQVAGWTDNFNALSNVDWLTVRLIDIPKNTPPNTSIYICGNFNGWVPGDERYQLKVAGNGMYEITIPIYENRLEYKFTRGNWSTVEGSSYGRPRPNRVLEKEDLNPNQPVEDSIAYWEDQSYGIFNPYTLVLVLTALQGFFLIFIINSNQNNNKWANQALSVLIFVISLTLIARVVIYDRVIYTNYPKLSLLTDLVFFLYGPTLLIYIKRLLHHAKKAIWHYWPHFVPFFLQCVIYVSFFFKPTHTFIEQNLFQSMDSPPYSIYEVIVLIALVFNIWYWFKVKNIINNYFKNIEHNYSTDQNIKYLNTILIILGICLVLWTVIILVDIYGTFTEKPVNALNNFLIDGIWIVFSVVVFFLGYFAIKQPQIFRMPEEEENQEEKAPEIEKSPLESEELESLKQALHQMMIEEQVYLNPQLSLPELAERMNSNVHTLSRAINAGFNKNFRDFVNHYRIEDFIVRAQDEKYKNQTFLAIALAVGFNSKSSFNRSFKKVTNKSPREYFNDLEQNTP
ncbi:helix-turn-helix domain-containing protein [Flavobacterium sp. ASW18X]|uniref:helix-turn-helix domain-containing protein n=1 Tax=Flavobacterium sp. ASW18X TaxID=2572595 RepID=UPI0010AE9625|nr:helix-turn-helix domain-containing protein [Flavobacterium sp. ASW18X]TKD62504.1 helix-turn-helix domain-containing protein [Flavobacterium sp. ASW18X]